MKRYSFLIFILLITGFSSLIFTSNFLYDHDRFNSMKDYIKELEEYDLIQLEDECIENNEEACFVLEKLLNKELKEILEIARATKKIKEQQTKDPSYDNFPEWLKDFLIKIRRDRLQRQFNRQIKKLSHYNCSSPTDLEPFKECIKCKKGKLKNKYQKLLQKYPKENFPSYQQNNEHSRIKTIQHHKKMCFSKYGDSRHCIELRKLEKSVPKKETTSEENTSSNESKKKDWVSRILNKVNSMAR